MTTTPTHTHRQHDAPPRPLAVLVVDDDPKVCRAVARLLHALGCLAIEASGASHALRLATSDDEPVDLVLSDVCMPGVNGVELRRALKRRDPDIPVLLMSANATDELSSRGIDARNIPLLSKPFGLEELEQLLVHATGSRRA